MDYFNLNAYYLGVLLFACLFISNITYSLICLIWKIKIVEFALFANAWFSLHREKVLGTVFILGWLPFSSHIKPLGMTADAAERAKINPVRRKMGLSEFSLFFGLMAFLYCKTLLT